MKKLLLLLLLFPTLVFAKQATLIYPPTREKAIVNVEDTKAVNALFSMGLKLYSEQMLGGRTGGVVNFKELGDVPNSYIGQAGKCVVVNGTQNGLEYTACSGGSATLPQDLYATSTPSFAGITIGTLTGYIKGSTGVFSATTSIPYTDLTGAPSLIGYVPYTGASSDLNLGTHSITTPMVMANTSAGLVLHNNSMQDIAMFGPGGTQSATFYDGVKLNATASSSILSTDSSSNITALSTSTYPSLTELSYVKGVTSAAQTQLDSKNRYHGVVARPVGATNPLPTFLTTTTFTLGATANPISYYYQGTLVNVTSNKTVQLNASSTAPAGLYYIYFDTTTGNLLANGFPGISSTSNVLLASVDWNGTDYGLVLDERHNYTRNTDWHQWAHDTIGTRYESGITLTHNGGTGAAATFATTLGAIHDEDIEFIINAQTTGRLLRQTGATAYTFNKVLSTVPGYLGANGRPNVVNSTGYTLSELPSAANRYINVFVYATNDLTGSIYFFTETASNATVVAGGYTSLTNARAIPFPNVSNSGVGPELKPIYRLIWRADGVLQDINTALDDYRTVSSIPQGAGTVNTTASTVSFVPAGTITSGNVQSALEELDTLKAPVTAPTFATSITGSYLTASQLIGTGASKEIVSLPVATYPSLTEVTYVKGVTSAIQTQLNERLPLAGGTMSGNITLGENTNVVLNKTGSADGKYSGITIAGVAGSALAFGDVVHFQASDSRWELADANIITAVQGDARGLLGIVVLAAAGDGSATTILLQGFIRADTAFPTLTINGQVYLSETAGDITQTQPTTTDAVIRVLGTAYAAHQMYFNPSNDWMTHT